MRSIIAAVVLLASIVPLTAQQSNQPQGAPSVWNAKVDALSNFVQTSLLPLRSNTVSNFTPDAPITVTRIELQAAAGAFKFAGFFQFAPCSVLPAIQVTDGTNSFTLPIPNGPIGTATNGSSFVGSVSADSGPINLAFAAGTKISVVALPGDQGTTSSQFCNAGEINITVQYRPQSQQNGL